MTKFHFKMTFIEKCWKAIASCRDTLENALFREWPQMMRAKFLGDCSRLLNKIAFEREKKKFQKEKLWERSIAAELEIS